jgi:hypothetical protein
MWMDGRVALCVGGGGYKGEEGGVLREGGRERERENKRMKQLLLSLKF